MWLLILNWACSAHPTWQAEVGFLRHAGAALLIFCSDFCVFIPKASWSSRLVPIVFHWTLVELVRLELLATACVQWAALVSFCPSFSVRAGVCLLPPAPLRPVLFLIVFWHCFWTTGMGCHQVRGTRALAVMSVMCLGLWESSVRSSIHMKTWYLGAGVISSSVSSKDPIEKKASLPWLMTRWVAPVQAQSPLLRSVLLCPSNRHTFSLPQRESAGWPLFCLHHWLS